MILLIIRHITHTVTSARYLTKYTTFGYPRYAGATSVILVAAPGCFAGAITIAHATGLTTIATRAECLIIKYHHIWIQQYYYYRVVYYLSLG